MIYLIGMSHGLAIMNAYDRTYSGMVIEDFERTKRNAKPLPSGFEALHPTGKRPHLGSMNAFLIPRQRGWGELVKLPDNAPADATSILVHRGFAELTSQIPREPGTLVLSALFGAEQPLFNLIEDAKPYDFVYPKRPDLAPLPGRQILPWPAIQMAIRNTVRKVEWALWKLRSDLPGGRLVHCAPPPPIESSEQILATPEILADQLAAMGVTPASIRLKAYLVQLDELTRITATHGIALLPPPARALTQAGFLRPEFSRGATHGNTAYGELVLDQLETWIQRGAAG